MRDSSFPVLHLVHPYPVKWATLFNPAARLLGLDLVSYSTWASKLASIASAGTELSADRAVEMEEENPALRIREFFHIYHSPTHENGVGRTIDVNGSNIDENAAKGAMGMRKFSLQNALQVSSSLKDNCAPLTVDDLTKWLRCWELVH